MRVIDGSNIMDETSIHPESYAVASKLLEDIGYTAKDVGKEVLVRRLDGINLDEYSKKLGVDKYTLEDIIKCLKQPNRDFRDDFEKPILKSDILKIEDLKKEWSFLVLLEML